MNKLIAYIKKPADKTEIFSIIQYFKCKEVIFYTNSNEMRVSKKEIEKWMIEFDVIGIVEFIDLKKETLANFSNKLIKDKKFTHIALPIGISSLFYRVVPLLKKQNKTVIQLSDGITDAFTLFNANLAVRGKNIKSFIKIFFVFPFYLRAKADFCFFQLYPLKSCFANKTLPLEKDKITPNKIELLNGIKTLIVPGWGLDVNELKNIYNITDSYCATFKEKKININGCIIELDNSITGEDVVDFTKIDRVIGTASTVLIYAKLNFPNLKVDCVRTNVLTKTFGIFYEREYIKLGKKLGINFIKNKID